jgi:CheY-like chemotaxis protein
MTTAATGAKDNDGGKVGGARADFVASLGRKVNDARELLGLLEQEPTSKALRDELRRRLHALGAGARLLRFEAMTQALQELLAVLDRGAQTGTIRELDVGFVARVLDDLPALAWGEVPSREAAARAAGEPAVEGPGPIPIAALVVGSESLVHALGENGPIPTRAFECERIEDVDKALELARAHAPDLAVVDVDLPRAAQLVEALLDDPLTDPVPVVVLGTFRSPEEVARFVALGVTRTLTKPVSAELLRATCDEIVDTHDERTMRVTLGEPTLEQLGDRLAEELRRALVDSVDSASRSQRIPLGEGSDVLAALWGTIARVQEIVVRKTGGAIRFGGDAPEGAFALAPWLHQDLPATDRITGRTRGAAADVRLNGRRVLVADDDPGVTWFISDLLRTAGCVVHEALDGTMALDLAFRVQPELVVSDILMPGMDGFALCRALRRDVALRDTPVILLSWKEDLLQRVRELGASAAAYLRKESGSRAILARVREVLRPRARIELRLRGEGEVRGRLDGLTPRLLLELVCLIRKDARVSVRDATHLYEVEIRAGSPRRATRTASDGSYRSGERALASLLGVGAGRFVVAPSSEPIHGELTGTLFDQLAGPIALARGALSATTGARMTGVERIVFDHHALDAYLRATPEPTRSLVRRLAHGATPRQMLLEGEASPSLIEDLLSDLAARGAIQAVQGVDGVDVLTPAVDAARAVLRGSPEPNRSVPPNARASAPSPPTRAIARDGEVAPSSGTVAPDEEIAPSAPRVAAEREASSPLPPVTIERSPSSLEDAVMREISERATEPQTARSATEPPPIVRPSELRPRSSNPPDNAPALEEGDSTPGLASLPPDAVVPAEVPPTNEAPEVRPVFAPDESFASAPPPSRSQERWPLILATGLLLAVVAAVLYWTRPESASNPAPQGTGSSAPSVLVAASAPTASAAVPSLPTASSAEEDLPPGAEVPAGYGLLEVHAPENATVRVDGTVAGSGPFVARITAPGSHEVRVDRGGLESTQVIEVHKGKATRVRSTLPL